MSQARRYFFCGIGGSGMLPLALILRAQGHVVDGSDRALDQGRTSEKFEFLRARGVGLFPQDGGGVTRADQILVASAAVEETVPDVQAATRAGAARTTRARLLADLFNAAPVSVAVGGTSGKSTTTAMVGWILHHAGRDPTIMNGAVMKNFMTADFPFASAVVGEGDVFVSEVDESDGSIADFNPTIAVLNNIALDHKSLDELRALFADFVARAETAVINLDNAEAAAIAARTPPEKRITFGLADANAQLSAANLAPSPDGVAFEARDRDAGATAAVRLAMPGAHNVANALAALSAARACGVGLEAGAAALNAFTGVRRRLERVGAAGGVTVIDDFAHNPDKIAASLATLHEFPGRLLVMFQPQGYGPLKLLKKAFIAGFTADLGESDVLIMSPPADFGGTTDRTLENRDAIIEGVRAGGRTAYGLADRAACGDKLVELAQPGDRIVIMGARDDTLSQFAADVLARVSGGKA